MRARILAVLALAACGEPRGDFNGRVEGSIEGPLAGESWYCEDASRAYLVMEDPRRKSTIIFNGARGGVEPGAWLLASEAQPGGFGVSTQLEKYPDPDADRLGVSVMGGTLTIDAVRDGVVSGRYSAETVTVDVAPTLRADGRVGRVPNRAGKLVGFFKAVKKDCPAQLPGGPA